VNPGNTGWTLGKNRDNGYYSDTGNECNRDWVRLCDRGLHPREIIMPNPLIKEVPVIPYKDYDNVVNGATEQHVLCLACKAIWLAVQWPNGYSATGQCHCPHCKSAIIRVKH
jgi:hypothetical protein